MVTIAYWDTQGGSRPPRLLGEYQGTPTIRLFTPKRKPKKAGSVSEKNVVDYQHGERNAADLRKFLEYQLPNYVERVRSGPEDYDRFLAKAERFGLPLVVVFTTKPKTSTTLKWLSAEYRRRVLMVEVFPGDDKNRGLEADRFGAAPVEDDTAAALYVVPPGGGEPVRYEGDSFSRRKLNEFLKQHALSKPALAPKEGATAAEKTPPPPKPDESSSSSSSSPPPKHDEF